MDLSTPVFSFGSNSLTQLRGRVHNLNLTGEPARAEGWVRIFCLWSSTWRGSVASIAQSRSPGAVVYGTVVHLSKDELERLDEYEAGYHKVELRVIVGLGGREREETAVAYVANHPHWSGFPSEQYLTAIRLMLSEQYPLDHAAMEPLEIHGILSSKEPVLLHQHEHPDPHSLSMPSLIVLANSKRKETPWKMPAKIWDIISKLDAVGIVSTVHLGISIIRGELNDLLQAKGFQPFTQETLAAFAEVLKIDLKEVQDTLHNSEHASEL